MALMGVSRRDLSFDIFRDRRCLGSNLNLRARVARLAHAHDVRFVGCIPMGIPYRSTGPPARASSWSSTLQNPS